MTAKNEHTGAYMKTKEINDAYDVGYERIFGKKQDLKEVVGEKTELDKPEQLNE